MSPSPGGRALEWRRLTPGIAALAGYRRSWLRGDLLAGVTVAAYLVPQVMAYAGVAGLPPVAGLWAILPALALYAVLGSSRLLSVGPESTTALMTATVVGPLAAGDPGRYATPAAALAITAGLLCLAAWAVRLGFVADLLSRPVLIGYLAGVALIMIVDQLPKLTGVSTTGSAFFPQLWSFLRHLGQLHTPTLLFAAVTLPFLFTVAHMSRTVPGPLLAVVLGTAAAVLGLDDRYGIKVIGHVPAGLPSVGLPDLTELPRLVLPALGVLLVAYTDVILTARAFTGGDEDEGPGLDADQEFLALGAANLGVGVLHGFP
jgi:MFS superfamily sulfate permease-like transporter